MFLLRLKKQNRIFFGGGQFVSVLFGMTKETCGKLQWVLFLSFNCQSKYTFVLMLWKTARKIHQIEREQEYICGGRRELGISLPSNSFPPARRPLWWVVHLVAISAHHPSSASATLVSTPKVSALSALLPVSYGPLPPPKKCNSEYFLGRNNIAVYLNTQTIL